MKRLSVQKIVKKAVELMRKGATPQRLAAGITLGGVMGVIPVLGISTIICLGLALVLRLSIPISQLANYVVYPLQILLLGVYYAAGAWLFGDDSMKLSPTDILNLVQNDLIKAIRLLKDYTIYAISAWALTTPILAGAIYLPVQSLLKRLSNPIKR